jgi:predicted nucleic acid-binding protein
MILVDSNILIYAVNEASPKIKQSQEFLQTHRSEIAIAHQNILESLRVITHPKFQVPHTIRDALEALERITSHATVIAPNKLTVSITWNLIQDYEIKANQIFDAYLAATALSWGIDTIATDNTKDFMRITEIKVINPFVDPR